MSGPPSGSPGPATPPPTEPPKERPPPPPAAPRSIPRLWWIGLGFAVVLDGLFAGLSIAYGSLLEVDAVLAAAEMLLAVVGIFGIYIAVVYGRGG